MKSLRTKLAAVVIAAAALVAAPAAANAYTPDAVSGPSTIAPGGSGTFVFDNFASGESVTFSIDGPTTATLALVKAVVTPGPTKNADASGAVSVTVTLPSNASGTYTLSAAGATSGTATATITVSAAGGGLPPTGVDSASLMGVWIGGGVLLLGGLAVTVFAVRRQRQDA